MASKIKNIFDLRNDLLAVYDDFRDGKTSATDVREVANLSSKVVSTVKMELQYNAMKHSNKISTVKFMENATVE